MNCGAVEFDSLAATSNDFSISTAVLGLGQVFENSLEKNWGWSHVPDTSNIYTGYENNYIFLNIHIISNFLKKEVDQNKIPAIN